MFFKQKEVYNLTFWVESNDLGDLESIEDNDGTVHIQNDNLYVHFNYEANNCAEAVGETWGILESAGFGVRGVLEGVII